MPLYLGDTRVTIRNIVPGLQYNVVGDVSITNGIASNFTDKTNYLLLSQPFNPGNSKWIFKTKFKFSSSSGTQTLIDRTESRCFQISITNANKIKLHISKDGSGKTNEVTGTHALSTNTWYYLTFEYTGTQYICKYSTDGINWTTEITINQTAAVYQGQILQIGRSIYQDGSEHWTGEVDLWSTYLGLNTELLNVDSWNLRTEWEGYKEGDYTIIDGRLIWANPNIYLESSGTQYIDTGIKSNSELEVRLKWYQQSGQVFGNLETSDGINKSFGYDSSNSDGYFRVGNGFVRPSGTYNIPGWHTIIGNKTTFIRDNITFTLNGGTYSNSNNNINLFRYRGGSTALIGKISYFQLYKLDNLIQHLVPVPTGMQIGEFTVPSNGMFDIVNQQFYPNQGTGTFTYGKD